MARVTIIPSDSSNSTVISYLKEVVGMDFGSVEEGEKLRLICSRDRYEQIRRELGISAIVFETVTLPEFLKREGGLND